MKTSKPTTNSDGASLGRKTKGAQITVVLTEAAMKDLENIAKEWGDSRMTAAEFLISEALSRRAQEPINVKVHKSKPIKRAATVAVPLEKLDLLKRLAVQEGRTVANMSARLIEEGLTGYCGAPITKYR